MGEPEHRQEIIHVKGKPDVTLDVVTTRHGPIITESASGRNAQDRPALDAATTAWGCLLRRELRAELGRVPQGLLDFCAPGTKRDVRRRGRTHRISGDRPGADPRGRRWQPAGERQRRRARVEGLRFRSTRCRVCTIRPPGFWRPPTAASLPTATSIRSARNGKRRGGPTASTACSNRARSLRPPTCWRCKWMCRPTYDRFCADKFVYALDHAANALGQAKRAADILRDWDGRMSADSAAPTIETKARQELVTPAAGTEAGPGGRESRLGALNWKSYRWSMSTVWLENVLTKQPARWLPPGYSDYGSLLTAAVENALKQPERSRADLGRNGNGAKNYPVEIDHLVLSQLPLIGRFTGPGRHPLSGSVVHGESRGTRVWRIRTTDVELRQLRRKHAEPGDRRKRNLSQPVLHGPVAGVVWRIDVRIPVLAAAVEKHRTHEMTLEPK